MRIIGASPIDFITKKTALLVTKHRKQGESSHL